jgi:hypothetical protein
MATLELLQTIFGAVSYVKGMSFAEVAARQFFTPVPSSSSHLTGQRTRSSHLPEVFEGMPELIFAIQFFLSLASAKPKQPLKCTLSRDRKHNVFKDCV